VGSEVESDVDEEGAHQGSDEAAVEGLDQKDSNVAVWRRPDMDTAAGEVDICAVVAFSAGARQVLLVH
jgi:hypothetical protein